MKKIWLFVLSFISIFSAWVSFADVIEPNTHYVDRCVKIENPHEISWYKLIIWRGEFDYGDISYSVYDVIENTCLPEYYHSWSHGSVEIPYLIDENIDVSALNNDKAEIDSIKEPSIDFESKLWDFIKFDRINPNGYYVYDFNPLESEIITYKIVKNWDNYTLEVVDGEDTEKIVGEMNYALEIVKTEQGIAISENRLIKFWIAWIITILIETIVLFIIAKLFRKKDQIPNWRLILIWILASTITLPLLRFVLPLFIVDKVGYIIIWELSVTLIEIFIIKYWLKISRTKAIIASIVCNLCSYLLGLLIF